MLGSNKKTMGLLVKPWWKIKDTFIKNFTHNMNMEDGGQAEYLDHIKVYELIKEGNGLEISLMGEAAIPALKKVLDGGDFWEQLNAVEALGMIGGERAERLLKSVLREGEWNLKKSTIRILEGKELGWLDKELKGLAKDPDFNVSQSALNAIRRRKGRPRRRIPDNFGNCKSVERGIAGQ